MKRSKAKLCAAAVQPLVDGTVRPLLLGILDSQVIKREEAEEIRLYLVTTFVDELAASVELDCEGALPSTTKSRIQLASLLLCRAQAADFLHAGVPLLPKHGDLSQKLATAARMLDVQVVAAARDLFPTRATWPHWTALTSKDTFVAADVILDPSVMVSETLISALFPKPALPTNAARAQFIPASVMAVPANPAGVATISPQIVGTAPQPVNLVSATSHGHVLPPAPHYPQRAPFLPALLPASDLLARPVPTSAPSYGLSLGRPFPPPSPSAEGCVVQASISTIPKPGGIPIIPPACLPVSFVPLTAALDSTERCAVSQTATASTPESCVNTPDCAQAPRNSLTGGARLIAATAVVGCDQLVSQPRSAPVVDFENPPAVLDTRLVFCGAAGSSFTDGTSGTGQPLVQRVRTLGPGASPVSGISFVELPQVWWKQGGSAALPVPSVGTTPVLIAPGAHLNVASYSAAAGTTGMRWSVQEDASLYDSVQLHGMNWSKVAADLGQRTARQCSDRWRRYGPLLQQERSGLLVRDRSKYTGGLPSASTATFQDPSFDETLKLAAAAGLKEKPLGRVIAPPFTRASYVPQPQSTSAFASAPFAGGLDVAASTHDRRDSVAGDISGSVKSETLPIPGPPSL